MGDSNDSPIFHPGNFLIYNMNLTTSGLTIDKVRDNSINQNT